MSSDLGTLLETESLLFIRPLCREAAAGPQVGGSEARSQAGCSTHPLISA
jgi:hypothetical protein